MERVGHWLIGIWKTYRHGGGVTAALDTVMNEYRVVGFVMQDGSMVFYQIRLEI